MHKAESQYLWITTAFVPTTSYAEHLTREKGLLHLSLFYRLWELILHQVLAIQRRRSLVHYGFQALNQNFIGGSTKSQPVIESPPS